MTVRPDIADVRAAAERIRPYAHRTPVMTCAAFDALIGGKLFFKCENFQKAGAFKFRGACNAIMSLAGPVAKRGVATHSSGNHGAALALAARLRGISAHIVMPENASAAKRAAIESYGGVIRVCEPTLAARESATAVLIAETGATLIHPYDDDRVIAGQGTAALELLDEVPDLDMIVAPVGGGGLLSGTGIAAKGSSKPVMVVGAEPEQADDAYRSLTAGRLVAGGTPDTVADGLRATLSERTFAIIQGHVREIVTVSEQAIIDAMRQVWERMKIVIEPSSAVPVAALMNNRLDVKNKRVGVLLSGGNIDLAKLPWINLST
jgi:threonine dehydratase